MKSQFLDAKDKTIGRPWGIIWTAEYNAQSRSDCQMLLLLLFSVDDTEHPGNGTNYLRDNEFCNRALGRLTVLVPCNSCRIDRLWRCDRESCSEKCWHIAEYKLLYCHDTQKKKGGSLSIFIDEQHLRKHPRNGIIRAFDIHAHPRESAWTVITSHSQRVTFKVSHKDVPIARIKRSR